MAGQPRVLVVDDEMSVRQSMRLMLRREFDVTTVEDGSKAIQQIRDDPNFDVVSLDLRMPGMSGIETLKQIKQWCPTTEVLIVTGYADVESAKAALKFGAYDYIDKPIDKEALRAAIRKGVERKRKTVETTKVQQELELAKAQLAHTERLSAIGELIASVAHELNNPLTGVIGFSELLITTPCTPEQQQQYLQYIHNSALLCEQIIQRLLTFSRKQDAQREYLQINQVVERTLDLKRHQFRIDHIEIVTRLAPNLPGTVADSYQLQQVFLNLLNNAHQAMKQQRQPGVLTVTTEFDDQRIRISFRDTGPGIPKENLQKIFEPFFTTKEKGKGTGLGLSVSYDIIKEHGGDIYVASEPGKGACFIIEIPIVDEAPS